MNSFWDNRRTRFFGIVILLTIQAGLLVGLNWITSINRTEVGHLGAAVYFWKTGKFDVFHVNPPLTRMIDGIPFFLFTSESDWKAYSPRPQDRSEWNLGMAFIQANSPEKIRWCVFLSRCSLIPLILLGSFYGIRFASELFGNGGGFLFLTLWVFSPLVLGWGATICPDVVASSLGIIAIYRLWHFLKIPNWKNAGLAGILLGLLPLAKMTWIIAFPLWIILWAIWKCPEWKRFVTVVLIAVYVINMGYFFDGSFKQFGDYTFHSQTLTGIEPTAESIVPKPGNRFRQTVLENIPVPLPSEFIQGLDTQKRDFETGLPSYFYGESSQHGWWNYYLVTLAIKEPLGIWGLFLLAVFMSVFDKTFKSNWRNELMLFCPALALLLVVSAQTGFSIHPRYIIPMLPLIYLWIGKLAQTKNRTILSFASFFVLWIVSGSLYYYPYSMSYFNESIGGARNGPKYLLGSNIDWGQNLYLLDGWYKKHPKARPFRTSYTGGENPKRFGMNLIGSVTSPLETGWYAVGVNELYELKEYKPFRDRTPIDRIGWSIFIYHIENEKEEGTKNE